MLETPIIDQETDYVLEQHGWLVVVQPRFDTQTIARMDCVSNIERQKLSERRTYKYFKQKELKPERRPIKARNFKHATENRD